MPLPFWPCQLGGLLCTLVRSVPSLIALAQLSGRGLGTERHSYRSNIPHPVGLHVAHVQHWQGALFSKHPDWAVSWTSCPLPSGAGRYVHRGGTSLPVHPTHFWPLAIPSPPSLFYFLLVLITTEHINCRCGSWWLSTSVGEHRLTAELCFCFVQCYIFTAK